MPLPIFFSGDNGINAVDFGDGMTDTLGITAKESYGKSAWRY